jgi:RNA polymerase sigma-70 factor (ECF subfamily)
MTPNQDDNAVEWLRSVMDRHEPALLRFAGRILGDAERARDVVQETFLRLLESGRAGQDDHLAEWLFTVCRNGALDVCRKERRMSLMGEQRERDQVSGEASPPASAALHEEAARVTDALHDLPANQREVIRLKFQNGFSYRQIAGITGLSVSNVGFLIHTGIQNLRKRFRSDGLLDGPGGKEIGDGHWG